MHSHVKQLLYHKPSWQFRLKVVTNIYNTAIKIFIKIFVLSEEFELTHDSG